MNLSNKIYIHKPTKLFVIISIFVFLIWINYLPINWRTVDDYGPVEDLFSGKINLIDQAKYLFYWFWGSYPPIWHFWAFNSYIFKNISIDISRNILLIQGYISVILSALLMSSLCQQAIKNKFNSFNLKQPFYIKTTCDFLSVTIIAFNPQIVIHATTYMPYNLGFITTTYCLLFIYFVFNQENIEIEETSKYFSFSKLWAFLFFLISSTFIFQTYIIIFPSILISILLKFKFNLIKTSNIIKKNILIIFDKENFNSKKFLNCFLIFLVSLFLIGYLRKLFILFNSGVAPATWSFGIDNVYQLNDYNLSVSDYLNKLFFNLINIFGQSLYPFQKYQIFYSILITSFVYLSFLILYRVKEYKFLIYCFISILIFAIYFATFQSLSLSPTRHNIYLLPIPVFSFISLILFIFFCIEVNDYSLKKVIWIIPLISIFIFYIVGFSNSLKAINYPNNLKKEAIQMAKDADYFLDLNYLRSNISPGFFQSHGDEENNALKGKECTLKKLTENKQNSFKLFIYSNEKDVYSSIKNNNDFLIMNSRGCLDYNMNTKVIKKISIFNNIGFEQNNLVNQDSYNYIYLIEIKKELNNSL